MFDRILNKMKMFNNLINNAEYLKNMQVNTYSNALISNILGNSYLPRTGMSLSAHSLSYLLNEILINNRTNIIEFGSGISTILMAKLAVTNKIKLKITSVDEDNDWIIKLNEILSLENLQQFVEFIYAPIKNSYSQNRQYLWYDEDILNKEIKNQRFDMIIVDGPKAYEDGKSLIRYGALPFIFNKLQEDFVVFLDDINRVGEKSIITNWENEFNLKFNFDNRLAVAYKGKHFFANPI